MCATSATMFVACLVVLLLGLGVCDLYPSPVMVTGGCLDVLVMGVTGWWVVCVRERAAPGPELGQPAG